MIPEVGIMTEPIDLETLMEREYDDMPPQEEVIVVMGPGYDLNPYSKEYKMRNAKTTAWSPGHS